MTAPATISSATFMPRNNFDKPLYFASITPLFKLNKNSTTQMWTLEIQERSQKAVPPSRAFTNRLSRYTYPSPPVNGHDRRRPFYHFLTQSRYLYDHLIIISFGVFLSEINYFS